MTDAPDLDAFKARLPLVDVVGRHVRLTRRGREHVGLCPFHKEKSPSFNVVAEKGFFHCFGCGAHGNAIDFVMRVEGLSFPDALQRLADLTGVPAPRRSDGPARPKPDDALHRANEAAARWFAGRLTAPEGASARRYLEGRGLSAATVERFGLGLAPDGREGLKRALLREGFEEARLVEAGLVIAPEDGGAGFDRFRNRVMFPIHDPRGRVVAFGGRALGEARAKYLNSPETPVFKKGELLYNLASARAEARGRGTVLVVEGYVDAIALAQAGFPHAVAPLGTALTEAQLALLWRATERPTLCLDGDAAGLRAAKRVLERVLPLFAPDKAMRFALLPPGEDPDSFVRARGPEAFAKLLTGALSLEEFLWRAWTTDRDLSGVAEQASLKADLMRAVDLVPDREFKYSLRRSQLNRLDSLRTSFSGAPANRSTRGGGASAPALPRHGGVGGARLRAGLADPVRLREGRLLAPLLLRPDLLLDVEEEVGALVFADPRLDALRQELLFWLAENDGLEHAKLDAHLARTGFSPLAGEIAVDGRASPEDHDTLLTGWRRMVQQYRPTMLARLAGDEFGEAIAEARDEREIRSLRSAHDRALNREDRSS